MAEMTDDMLILEQYQGDLGRFLLKIQTVHVLDLGAFEKLDAEIEGIMRLVKNKLLLPKSLLHDMRVAIKILRAEAVYMSEKYENINNIADRLEMAFDLILLGEDRSGRIPGVPRII